MENNVKSVNLNYQLAKIALLVTIIAVLWYCAKSISITQAQDLGATKTEHVYHMIDTSSAQENPVGSGMYVANDIDAHPELIYVDTIVSKQSLKGIILKYLVIYRKR